MRGPATTRDSGQPLSEIRFEAGSTLNVGTIEGQAGAWTSLPQGLLTRVPVGAAEGPP